MESLVEAQEETKKKLADFCEPLTYQIGCANKKLLQQLDLWEEDENEKCPEPAKANRAKQNIARRNYTAEKGEKSMKIPKEEYENLIRDSEKLRVIESMALANQFFNRDDLLIICGFGNAENEKCTKESE